MLPEKVGRISDNISQGKTVKSSKNEIGRKNKRGPSWFIFQTKFYDEQPYRMCGFEFFPTITEGLKFFPATARHSPFKKRTLGKKLKPLSWVFMGIQVQL